MFELIITFGMAGSFGGTLFTGFKAVVALNKKFDLHNRLLNL